MDSVAEDLKLRTKRFALAILDFLESVQGTPAGHELKRQLLRSAFGVAGNYRSACRARSHAEFTARLGIVLEEIGECERWLDIIDEKHLGTPVSRTTLLEERRQLRAIFSRACVTARAQERRL